MKDFFKGFIATWLMCACASFSFCYAFDLPWNFKTTIGVFVAYIFIQFLKK